MPKMKPGRPLLSLIGMLTFREAGNNNNNNNNNKTKLYS